VLDILYYAAKKLFAIDLRYGKRVRRRKELVKNSGKKNENELIKTSTFLSASSISYGMRAKHDPLFCFILRHSIV